MQPSSSTGKVYTADLSFSYLQGQAWCHPEYTNYSGTLGDAPVERLEDDAGGYLFQSSPEGEFYSNTHRFVFRIGPEQLSVSWYKAGEDGEPISAYQLDRGTGAVSEQEADYPSFDETENYHSMLEKLDSLFDRFERHYRFDADTKTFTAFFGLGSGMRGVLLSNPAAARESWSSLVESVRTINDTMYTVVKPGTRHGIPKLEDFLVEPRCRFVVVETLNANDEYYPQDTLAVFLNGNVEYDVLDDAAQGSGQASGDSGAQSGSASATMGERNALKRAGEYLDYTAFSYTGLIGQLEYEGYRHSEAVYAADHCGADWNHQAARKARQYLDYSSFSRSGLISQLEYEGFTHSQAVYGVEQNGY